MQTDTDIEQLLDQILFLTPEEKHLLQTKIAAGDGRAREAVIKVLQRAVEKQRELFSNALQRDSQYAEKFLAFLEEAFGSERRRFEARESEAAEHILDQPQI